VAQWVSPLICPTAYLDCTGRPGLLGAEELLPVKGQPNRMAVWYYSKS
jgi:hypothetical protein